MMAAGARREGVTLVELLVAVTLIGVIVTSLGGLSFQAARQSVVLAGDGYLRGVVTQEINRLHAIPFVQLHAGTTCVTDPGGAFPHTRCQTVTVVSPTQKSVTITVTPSQPGVRPPTVTLARYQSTRFNALNSP